VNLNRQPKPVLGLLVAGIIMAIYFNVTGNWDINTQILSVGMIGVALSMMVGEKPRETVTIDWVERASYAYVRKAQTDGRTPTGSLTRMMETREVLIDGEPRYWETGIRVESTEHGNPIYLLRVDLYKSQDGNIQVTGTTEKAGWSAAESPDVVVLTPPDVLTYMKLKQKFESEGGKKDVS